MKSAPVTTRRRVTHQAARWGPGAGAGTSQWVSAVSPTARVTGTAKASTRTHMASHIRRRHRAFPRRWVTSTPMVSVCRMLVFPARRPRRRGVRYKPGDAKRIRGKKPIPEVDPSWWMPKSSPTVRRRLRKEPARFAVCDRQDGLTCLRERDKWPKCFWPAGESAGVWECSSRFPWSGAREGRRTWAKSSESGAESESG